MSVRPVSGPDACNTCALVLLDANATFRECLSNAENEQCPDGYYRGIYNGEVRDY